MSIACPLFESNESSLDRVRAERARAKRPTSPRRVAANRRNAQRSTGPRTAEGKARASRNALKHGLCAEYGRLPSEDPAAFEMFLNELREEMRPRTVLQKHLFPQIANLLWNVQRLPEAHGKLFVRESGKAAVDEKEMLSAAEVLARRFSDDPGNGFVLMGRYERSMQNALMRMIRQFHLLQKHHADVPYDPDEPPCPPERAWSERRAREQREWFEKREAARGSDVGAALVSPDPGRADGEEGDTSVAPTGTPSGDAGERSQTKPTENVEKPSPSSGNDVSASAGAIVGDETNPSSGLGDSPPRPALISAAQAGTTSTPISETTDH